MRVHPPAVGSQAGLQALCNCMCLLLPEHQLCALPCNMTAAPSHACFCDGCEQQRRPCSIVLVAFCTHGALEVHVCCAVFLDGRQLRMAADENEQEHILALASGELMLLWQLHRPDVGEAVEITSGTSSTTLQPLISPCRCNTCMHATTLSLWCPCCAQGPHAVPRLHAYGSK